MKFVFESLKRACLDCISSKGIPVTNNSNSERSFPGVNIMPRQENFEGVAPSGVGIHLKEHARLQSTKSIEYFPNHN